MTTPIRTIGNPVETVGSRGSLQLTPVESYLGPSAVPSVETSGQGQALVRSSITPLIGDPATATDDASAAGAPLIRNELTPLVAPGAMAPTPEPDTNPVTVTSTLASYASQYGLLAGGILAVLIFGTIVVKKIVKRKK